MLLPEFFMKSSNGATMEQVARMAGVSRATVSRVVSNYPFVSKLSRMRVMEAISGLGYHPNLVAQSLAGRKTRSIAFIATDISNPFYSEIAKTIEDAVVKKGYTLLIGSTESSIDRETDLLKTFISRRVDGIILTTCGARLGDFEQISSHHIPIILLARKSEYYEGDIVAVDNVQGAYQAVEHLILRGCKRIGFLTGPRQVTTGEERYQGYIQALTRHGYPIEPALIVNGEFEMDKAYHLMKTFMESPEPPDGIFTANNMMAAGVIQYCEEKAIGIPDDLAVAAFDSFGFLDKIIKPRITANRVSLSEMGRDAIELLFYRIEERNSDMDFKEIRHRPELIVRDSTGRADDIS